MHLIGSSARTLPAPPRVVWGSLVEPEAPGARRWLVLLDDETVPQVRESEEPTLVVWSSLWPRHPRDVVRLELEAAGRQTRLRFSHLTPDEPPEAGQARHLRRRLNHLLFTDFRFSFGQ